MNFELENKVVVLTGATGGIGSEIAKDFLVEGAVVVCLIRNEDKMISLKDNFKNQGINTEKLLHFSCDLLDYSAIKSTIEQILKAHSVIDVLVNCAGFADEFPFAMMDEKQISTTLDVNLKSPMFLSHAVLRPMFKQNSGCIINISSASAVRKGRGIVAYAAAKSGVETLTRTLAYEVGRKNIRINCIRPGLIDTPMSDAVRFRHQEHIKDSTALGRTGKPNEISKTVLFVASPLSSYMTGECITVDGGIL